MFVKVAPHDRRQAYCSLSWPPLSICVFVADTKGKPKEIALPDGTFVLYLAGQYNKRARDAYLRTHKSDSCASYVSFHNMTHYGMNDFVSPPESHQVQTFTKIYWEPCPTSSSYTFCKWTLECFTMIRSVCVLRRVLHDAYMYLNVSLR
jgi:hypothetical protein